MAKRTHFERELHDLHGEDVIEMRPTRRGWREKPAVPLDLPSTFAGRSLQLAGYLIGAATLLVCGSIIATCAWAAGALWGLW